MSYLPDVSLGLLAMEKSADICVRLSFFSLTGAGSVSRLGSLRRLLALTRKLGPGSFSSLNVCKYPKDAFSPPFRPGPVCYNVTMEEEILPCSRIYTYCDITGMPCAGACWEM